MAYLIFKPLPHALHNLRHTIVRDEGGISLAYLQEKLAASFGLSITLQQLLLIACGQHFSQPLPLIIDTAIRRKEKNQL